MFHLAKKQAFRHYDEPTKVACWKIPMGNFFVGNVSTTTSTTYIEVESVHSSSVLSADI